MARLCWRVPRPWPRRSCVSRRATLPLRSVYSERAPALTRLHLALLWRTSGITPPPPPIVSPITAFLLHARRQAADRAADPIPGAPAPAGVPRLPPLATSATDDGALDVSPVTATRRAADVAVDPAPGAAAPAAFLLQIRQQAADGAVDPTPGAAPPAGASQPTPPVNSAADGDTVAPSPVTASRKRKGRVGDVATDVPDVTADGAACGTQAEPPAGPRKRRRARPHKARDAQRSLIHDGCPPPSPGTTGASHGADG